MKKSNIRLVSSHQLFFYFSSIYLLTDILLSNQIKWEEVLLLHLYMYNIVYFNIFWITTFYILCKKQKLVKKKETLQNIH